MSRVAREPSTRGQPLSKLPSGVRGLDQILEGGFPQGRTTLVGGGPGTGKTVLGTEFLHRGAADAEPGLLVSFEERPEAVRNNALSLGLDLEQLERAGKLFLMKAELPPDAIIAGDFDISGLLAIIAGRARAIGARRILLDAIDVLLRIFKDPARESEEFYSLHNWLRDQRLTAIVTAKTSGSGEHQYPHLDFMADCVLYLDQRVTGQVRTRRLRVMKYRGSGFMSNEHPYVISGRGFVLMPVASMTLDHPYLRERVSAGTPQLDQITGGGIRRGSSVLIGGASGTGKTTLASTFARAACARGERVLFIDFEESEEALVGGMAGSGIDLRPAIADGTLRILTAMPEARGTEEHLLRIFEAMEELEPDHLIVDAISATARMGSERAAFDLLVRLMDACKTRGITCIYNNQTRGEKDLQEIGGIPISSLIDMGISLGYVERDGGIQRRLLVLKSRGASHSMCYHEVRITGEGMQVLPLATEAPVRRRSGDGVKPEAGKKRGKGTAAGKPRPRTGGK